MNELPTSLPRASNLQCFTLDPFNFLKEARRAHGNVVVLREAGPLFSRAADCAGVVAVFGSEYQRTVLTDIESFGMPVSAARGLDLPQNLTNLNRGLHSMRADQHAVQKRLMMAMLGDGVVSRDRQVWETVENSSKNWKAGATISLLAKMRQLTLRVSSQLLLGERTRKSGQLSGLLARYFQLRREASSPVNVPGKVSRSQLIATGNAADRALRKYVRECRRHRQASPQGIVGRLAILEKEAGGLLSEDEVVGHSNVLFVSSTEPIAVSLTWILLVLSQLPALRQELRDESRCVVAPGGALQTTELGRLVLFDRVINETLRLLPPNAFMVRITTCPTSLGGVQLPAQCEVVLCPFVAHRDSALFERPDEFLPGRWKGTPPSPFDYFPFGAGGHSCAGRLLALQIIKTTLAVLLSRYDMLLASDQQIDWRVHIQFMPRNEPAVVVRRISSSSMSPHSGKLGGPVGALLGFDTRAP